MMKYLITFCFIAVSCFAFSQGKLQKKADKYFARGKCEKAAGHYKKIYDADKNNTTAALQLSRALLCAGEKSSAEAVLRALAAEPKVEPSALLLYAEVLRSNGKYNEADKVFKSYAGLNPNDTRTTEFSNFFEKVQPLTQSTGSYEIANIPENSPASDIGPSLNYSGVLVFSSNRNKSTTRNYLHAPKRKKEYKFYSVAESKQDVAEPVLIKGKLNKKRSKGTATFSRDGKEVIFSRTNPVSVSQTGSRNFGLYSAEWNAKKGWTNIMLLPFVNPSYNYINPSLSKDGQILFFSSDMQGGYGAYDLYVCLRVGTVWGAPQNLGKQINTSGNDVYPFIADDGTLYFSSDARIGLGGLDIYSATFQSKQYGNVQNLGAPVNSPDNDFGYFSDGTLNYGFFSSDRSGGMGSDDIYRFVRRAEKVCGKIVNEKENSPIHDARVLAELPNGGSTESRTNENGEFCLTLPYGTHNITVIKDGFHTAKSMLLVKATKNSKDNIFKLKPKGEIELVIDVYEKNTGKLEGATTFLIDKQSGQVIQAKTDSNGVAKFEVERNKEYELKVAKSSTKDGLYDRFIKTISTHGFTSASIKDTAALTFYKKEAVFQLPNVYFDLNSVELKTSARNDLNKLAVSMIKFPDVEIEISAHTDSQGDDEYNMQLSVKRANACVEYLVSKGVNPKKLIALGYGERKVLNKCKNKVPCTDKEHAVNRRIEFRVLNFD